MTASERRDLNKDALTVVLTMVSDQGSDDPVSRDLASLVRGLRAGSEEVEI